MAVASEGDGELGTNLRAERRRRGHTQKTLGAILDLGRGTVASIESGKVGNPGVYTLYGIATALGVPMEDLMGVPRVTDTTKARSRVREAMRAERAGIDGGVTLAEVVADISRRAGMMKVGPYEMPDAEDWAMFTAPSDLALDETVEAAGAYAEKWADDDERSNATVVAGAFVFALVVGSVRTIRRLRGT